MPSVPAGWSLETKVAQQQHGVGGGRPFRRIEPSVAMTAHLPTCLRRPAWRANERPNRRSRPCSVLARRRVPMLREIAQGLPADSRIPVKEPLEVAFRPQASEAL